jgi:hypothetical protein
VAGWRHHARASRRIACLSAAHRWHNAPRAARIALAAIASRCCFLPGLALALRLLRASARQTAKAGVVQRGGSMARTRWRSAASGGDGSAGGNIGWQQRLGGGRLKTGVSGRRQHGISVAWRRQSA